MQKHSIRASLLAALSLSWSIAGHAEKLDADTLRRLAPQQAKAWVLKQIEQQNARRAAQVVTAADATPPVLTRFDSGASVNAALAMSAITVAIAGQDDLSGVRSVGAYATGPSGQMVNVGYYDYLPTKKLAGLMSSFQISPFLEPGTYTFDWGYATDVAGNFAYLTGSDLAALGRSTFVVKNTKGFDATPPALVSGKVLTPQISLSAQQPGTQEPAFMGLTLEAADVGNTAVAGLRYAVATFCLLDASHCLGVWANDTGTPRRQGKSTLRLGGQIDPTSHIAGEYHLYVVTVTDYADNTLFLHSTEFGGTTDFSAYFPSTTITLNP